MTNITNATLAPILPHISWTGILEWNYTIDVWVLVWVTVIALFVFLMRLILKYRKRIKKLKGKLDDKLDKTVLVDLDKFIHLFKANANKEMGWSDIEEMIDNAIVKQGPQKTEKTPEEIKRAKEHTEEKKDEDKNSKID